MKKNLTRGNFYNDGKLHCYAKFLMMGFRLCNGIYLKNYENKFNSSLLDDFKDEIERLIKNDLIEITNGCIKIKKDKLFIANLVFREFVWKGKQMMKIK